ncbi:hypothetical protein [Amylibacter sp. IMCC11727]|uniref:hypothetical protein n=1 Tax=Amylibacter sp. IMCC11727 TaxID=3039851 RepID=UPI00244DD373|nr:hypothetical protein [Amylibacter sp. IMCC11727]WGI21578.1 hypothetical protein QBD29_15905 [Amylibacter sp. IMCC11727]
MNIFKILSLVASFNGMKSAKCAIGVLTALTVSTAPISSQPHKVIGVAANDVLNMRADIDYSQSVSDSKVVGTIPHDADDVAVTGISIDVNGAKWREVLYEGKKGWVNARFLKPTSLYLETPEALICGGTEPFWDLTINEGGGQYSTPEIEDPMQLAYQKFTQGAGRTDLWGHYLGSVDGTVNVAAIVRYTEACFDGMSDFTYDFEVLLLELGERRAPVYGCCRIQY